MSLIFSCSNVLWSWNGYPYNSLVTKWWFKYQGTIWIADIKNNLKWRDEETTNCFMFLVMWDDVSFVDKKLFVDVVRWEKKNWWYFYCNITSISCVRFLTNYDVGERKQHILITISCERKQIFQAAISKHETT